MNSGGMSKCIWLKQLLIGHLENTCSDTWKRCERKITAFWNECFISVLERRATGHRRETRGSRLVMWENREVCQNQVGYSHSINVPWVLFDEKSMSSDCNKDLKEQRFSKYILVCFQWIDEYQENCNGYNCFELNTRECILDSICCRFDDDLKLIPYFSCLYKALCWKRHQ